MRRRGQEILVAVSAAVLIFFVATTIILPGRDKSILESRHLAQKPALPGEIHQLKEYVRGWDAYLTDQMPFRDTWVKTYAFAQLRVLGKSEMNGVVVGDDGYLLRLTGSPAATEDVLDSKISQTVEQIAELDRRMHEYGGDLVFVGVPDKTDFMRDKLPSFVAYPPFRDMARSRFFAALTEVDIAAIDLQSVLEAQGNSQFYYRTDHHWTFDAAYLGYRAIMLKLGLPALQTGDLEYVTLPNEFSGSARRLLADVMPADDHFTIGIPTSPTAYSITVDSKSAAAGTLLYRLPHTDTEAISYGSIYPYVNAGELVVDTRRPSLPDILVIGDSFKGPVECLLLPSFNQTRHLDLRHYTAMSVIDYVKKYQPDYVVYVLSGISYLLSPWNVCDKPSKGSGGEE